jgi:hypothetical protein
MGQLNKNHHLQIRFIKFLFPTMYNLELVLAYLNLNNVKLNLSNQKHIKHGFQKICSLSYIEISFVILMLTNFALNLTLCTLDYPKVEPIQYELFFLRIITNKYTQHAPCILQLSLSH